MRRIAGLLLGLCWAARALGQPLDIGSDPAALARAALGADPGSASVAVWRGNAMAVATVRRGGPTGDPAVPAGSGADDAAPLYEIGSISKVFTGLLLAQAVERGDLALGDTLGQRLQGRLVFASAAVAAITLEQLVTHRACLPRQFGAVRGGAAVVEQLRLADRATLWSALAAQTLARSAPCDPVYSNYGMAVLGELLAEHYGKPWSVLVREQITAPLGMADTHLQLESLQHRLVPAFNGRQPAQAWDLRAFAGAGGLRSSAQDLVRFGRAIVQGRDGPLGAAAQRLVTPLAAFRGGQIGYAVFVDGPPERRTWSHDGLTGGYRAQLRMHPDSGEVLVALVANRQAPLPQLNAQLGAARYPVRAQPMALDGALLPQYAGVFRVDPELALVSVVQDGVLHVRSTGSVFRAYVPVAPDVFARPAGGAELRFARRDGAVVALELAQYGRVTPATRTTDPVPQQVVLAAGAAGAYVGRYQVARLLRSPIEFDVTDLDGQLLVRSSAFASQPVFPMAGRVDRFRYESPQAELQFERDAAGRVVALVLHENGTLRAVRTASVP
jgi:serine-type D-Ala-D-Ala carboxypeptidase/endopeptidase